jgi:hypothetical protein
MGVSSIVGGSIDKPSVQEKRVSCADSSKPFRVEHSEIVGWVHTVRLP